MDYLSPKHTFPAATILQIELRVRELFVRKYWGCGGLTIYTKDLGEALSWASMFKQGKQLLSVFNAEAGAFTRIGSGIGLGAAAISIGENIYGDVQAHKSPLNISHNIAVDVAVAGVEIVAPSLLGSAVAGGIGGSFGGPVGTVVGAAVGIGLYYFLDVQQYNGKTAHQWLRD